MSVVSTYLGVWRPGTGEQRWFTGSPSAFHTADVEFFNKGLRLVALDRHVGGIFESGTIDLTPEDRMIGVWQPGTGPQHWVTGWDIDAFKKADAQFFDKGLRLVAVDTGGGGVTAVWRPGKGAQFWEYGLSIDEFTQKDATYFSKGLRLVAVDIDNGKFFGVWRTGSGSQRWLSASFDTFEETNIEFMNQGLRLVAIDHDGGQFVGVWHSGTGAQYWYTGLTINEFKKKDDDYFANGLRLVAVDLGTRTIPSPSGSGSHPDGGGSSNPGQVFSSLLLPQNEPYTGAGGNSGWMYYTVTVSSDNPQKSLLIKKIRNSSNFEINLTHNGVTANMKSASETDLFNGENITGYWSAQLINVSGPFATTSIRLDLTLGQ